MKEYILAVCGAVILSSLALLIMPEGKTGKFIGGMLKLFCLLVMLIPLLALFRAGTFSDEIFGTDSQAAAVDESFIESVFERRAEQEESALEALLQEELEIEVEADVGWVSEAYAFVVKNVQINIKNFGIHEESEHIMIAEQAKERIAALYDGAEVSVYG